MFEVIVEPIRRNVDEPVNKKIASYGCILVYYNNIYYLLTHDRRHLSQPPITNLHLDPFIDECEYLTEINTKTIHLKSEKTIDDIVSDWDNAGIIETKNAARITVNANLADICTRHINIHKFKKSLNQG